MRGGIVVACELACWSTLGVSLAALMWSIVEPKGMMTPVMPADTALGPQSSDALVTRLSQAPDPFLAGLTAGASAVVAAPEASGYTLHATRAWLEGGGSAIIAAAGGAQGAYAVGEEISSGVRLAVVSGEHVELDVGGRRMRLSFPGSRNAEAPVFASQIVDASADYRASAGSATPLLLNSLALQPVSRNGRPAGFEVMPQATDGLLSAAGLRPGDVVVSINGIYASAGGDLSAYRKQLAAGQPVIIRYERAGQLHTTSFGTKQ
jgi:S1-C subfamily serine protease